LVNLVVFKPATTQLFYLGDGGQFDMVQRFCFCFWLGGLPARDAFFFKFKVFGDAFHVDVWEHRRAWDKFI